VEFIFLYKSNHASRNLDSNYFSGYIFDMAIEKMDKETYLYLNFVGFSFFYLLNFQSVVSS
jgi:hypothetical protein